MSRPLLERAAKILRDPVNRGRKLALASRVIRFRLACLLGRSVDLPFEASTRIRCWPDSDTARSVAYCAGPYDRDEMTFLATYLRPGDAVLDVGANIGTYAVLCGALTSPTGRVDAIEPVPETANRLRENLKLNGLTKRVVVHEAAVADSPGRASMTVRFDAANHVSSKDFASHDETITVALTTLDEIGGDRDIAFGKIDVEGMEWAALRGATRLLEERRPPLWMVEINGALERYGWTAASFIDWMEEHGFTACEYDSDRRVFHATRKAWDDVFFVARDHFHMVEQRVPGVRLEV